MAVFHLTKAALLDRFTFLDYIHAGCEVSTLLGMDFTLSNKHPKDPKSLHHVNPALHKFYEKQKKI